MTDDTFDASGPAGGLELNPDQIAAMRDQWTSLGLDPPTFDAAASGAPTPPLEVSEDLADATALLSLKMPSLTPQQAQEMAFALIDAGVPREQVEAALRDDGLAPAGNDARTDEEKDHDRAFGGAPPEAYRIDYVGRIPAGMDETGLAEFNRHATTWLCEVGFPEQIGPAVIERAMDLGQWLDRASPAERELWRREQAYEFERMAGGPDQAAERRAFAAAALARGGKVFNEGLFGSGALHDAGLLMHLSHQGERLAARS